ncbi:MAG: DnaD domain protein, partial [Chloroflexi bacterium]|nr:DnaD domain protein [Chloroflexota bacterium]
EIGVLTATIAEELKLAVSEYPDGWIIDALKEASRQNKRNWSYARAILKRWKAEGRGNGNRKQAGADVDKYRALYEQQKANN